MVRWVQFTAGAAVPADAPAGAESRFDSPEAQADLSAPAAEDSDGRSAPEASEGVAVRPGAPLQVLLEDGWQECGARLSVRLWQQRRASEIDSSLVTTLCRRSCCRIAPDAHPRPHGLLHLRTSIARWVLSPPLGWGAPRFLSRDRGVVDARAAGEQSFADALGNHVDDRLASDAQEGVQAARERMKGIEQRASTFVQAAGLTGTLVLVNQGLIAGDHPIHGTTAKWIFLAAIVAASLALIAAGVFGLAATMRTFDRIAPSNAIRVIKRSTLPAVAEDDGLSARTALVAATLLAQRRASLVADWKLARLKRAVTCFLAGGARHRDRERDLPVRRNDLQDAQAAGSHRREQATLGRRHRSSIARVHADTRTRGPDAGRDTGDARQ